MLDIYNEVREIDDEELEEYVRNKIIKLEIISNKENGGIGLVGFDVSYNPTDHRWLDDDLSKVSVGIKTLHYGYISRNTKMGYGLSITNGLTYNSGGYYYVDDDSYIYDFCKYIKGKEIENEFSLFTHVLSFMKKYFGVYPKQERNDIFKMIQRNDMSFYEPVKEHKFSDIKGTGAALCTEYALVAGNILTFFGFDNYVVIGSMSNYHGAGSHAFNILSYTNNRTKEDETAIVDFCSCVGVFDFDYNLIGRAPYILPIENFNEDFLLDFVCNEKHLTYDDYEYFKIGDKLFQIKNGEERDYFVSGRIKPTYYR